MLKNRWFQFLIAAGLSSCAVQPPAVNQNAKTVSQRHQVPKRPAQTELYENRPLSESEPVQVQTGRYSYLSAKPRAEQLNPLLSVIDVQIPDNIVTVKDSAQYLLQFSGYQLHQTVNPESQALLHQLIPEVHRHFEQVILRDALLALGGKGYRLRVDPVNRWVAYERDLNYPAWSQ